MAKTNLFATAAAKQSATPRTIIVSRDENWMKTLNGKTFAQVGATLGLDPEQVKFGRNTLDNGVVLNSLLFQHKGSRVVVPLSASLSAMRDNNELDAAYLLDCEFRVGQRKVRDAEGNETDETVPYCNLGKPSGTLEFEQEEDVFEAADAEIGAE